MDSSRSHRSNSPLQECRRLLLCAVDWLATRGRRLAVSLAVLAGAFTAVAFAVAPLAPDAAQLPQRLVTETLATPEVDLQLEALASQDLELTRSEVSRADLPLEALLRRLGVADTAALVALKRDAALRRLIDGRAGRLVQVRTDVRGELIELIVRSPLDDGAAVRTQFLRHRWIAQGGAWAGSVERVDYGQQVRLAGGSIRSSLFAASDEARIPDAVATQMAEIFSADIDFHRELRKGDSFSVVFESLTADGEPVPWNQGAGRVLAAEFVNGGRTHQAIWFESGGKGAYFDPSGKSRKRAFLASPLEFSRVTSGFAMRMHPILQRMRAHLGVDYAAPTGTPVRAVGDGTVEFAGWQSGYGNVVHLRHGADKTTVYAHLSRIDVRRGQRVDQGQRLGAVGMTGWATGPHLHFEFRVAGVHQDPLRMARATETLNLEAAHRPRFAEVARTAQTKLDLAESIAGRPAFE